MLKDWNWRTPITDTLNLDENKFACKKNLFMKEKALRDTQIRSMHEMGEMKRAQELRVEEFSVQHQRVSHETIQRITSQMQHLQGQMNSMNDSGEFQEVEPKSQWEIVSRSQSTCDDSEFSFLAQPRQKSAA